ncbi:FYN-binding protein 1-like isoform X1 [Polyodon spathula]|uniref:FYN-binding protein 1-like isoform X1 n=2 Tax=Polyodon spathula TaxID=7913 RepID=UPI001B7E16B8|nr:FYN-binding protein 1-like isoform X1 [Polyodon spathula]
MDNASGVKAMMARFNCEGSQPKIADHPPVSSLQPKKAAFEKRTPAKTENSLQGNPSQNIQPKPLFPKGSVKLPPDEKNLKEPFPKPKSAINKFNNINTQNEGRVVFPKSQFNGKPSEMQKDNETKPVFPKPLVPKPSTKLNQPEKEPKPLFPKPPSGSKPPWVTENSQNNDSNTKTTIPPKPPSAPKPKPGSFKVHQEQSKDSGVTESTPKAFPGVNLKPADSRNRDPVTDESRDSKFNDNKKEEASTSSNKPIHPREAFLSKVNQNFGGPPPGPKFISKKPSFQDSASEEKKDPSAPKRNTLPNIFALGSPPAKPNRPPNVNLDKFKKGAEFTSAVPNLGINNPVAPPPPPSHPGVQATPSLPSGTPLPSLPRGHPGAVVQPDPDETYDDVGMSSPPPLPAGKPGDGYPGNNEDDAIDEEMYEDLEERWSVKESKDEKKREKEEKKRLEQEKKEQKEKERKENDLKKRFKLQGPIEVIHKVKARVDYKGAKNELTVKQGETIDIIRITENPEGKWLGRTADGSYGYIKTVSVEIDYDTLKRQQKTALPSSSQRHVTEQDQDVYDDVGQEDDVVRRDPGAGLVLPPPPGEDDDIYNDVDDPDLNVSSASQEESKLSSWSWGLLKMIKGKDDKKGNLEDHLIPPPTEFSKDKAPAATDDEIYDDVESHDFPPPPPPSSLLKLKADPKKQKKFEKEEKEFRKKFKYDGEIQVLHQVTVVPALTNKKWGGKDLPLKPGEVLDVIQKAVDNKMICRNDEGKFGYVLNSNIIVDDADIYDDIGEGCIYDND